MKARDTGITYWNLFHRLWTKAVDTHNYDKSQWLALERVLLSSQLRDEKVDDA
jgi:hypothetical protein